MDVVFLGLFLELGFRHKINEIDTILRKKGLGQIYECSFYKRCYFFMKFLPTKDNYVYRLRKNDKDNYMTF